MTKKQTVIQITANDTQIFALTDTGSIFSKRLASSEQWQEEDEIIEFTTKEENVPTVPMVVDAQEVKLKSNG